MDSQNLIDFESGAGSTEIQNQVTAENESDTKSENVVENTVQSNIIDVIGNGQLIKKVLCL